MLSVKLASQLDTGMKDMGVYIDVNPQRTNTDQNSQQGKIDQNGVSNIIQMNADKLLEKSVLQPGFEKLEKVPKYGQKNKQLKKERRKEAAKTKGDNWFNLPATEMTEEKLRDLEVIQMRSILNPKQFYKKNDMKVVPKYFQVKSTHSQMKKEFFVYKFLIPFQVGTIVDSPVDFYHDRVPRKSRKKTLVDELMADADFQRYL